MTRHNYRIGVMNCLRSFRSLCCISLLGLLFCLIFAPIARSDGDDSVELRRMLDSVVGVYTDPVKRSDSGPIIKKTVVVTGANYGYMNHLHNLKCFTDRLGIKFLVISMDAEAHQYITTQTSMHSYLMFNGTNAPQKFRSKEFNILTARKLKAVYEILQLDYHVLFTDTDLAIVRDPLPYMIWENVDYVHSLNVWCNLKDPPFDFRKSRIEGNTGFYFVKANSNTRKLWLQSYEAAPTYRGLDDQAVFWSVIRKTQDPETQHIIKCRDYNSPNEVAALLKGPGNKRKLVACALDTCVFSSGMISHRYVPEMTYDTLLKNLKEMNETVCTLHANYMSGNELKMKHMRDNGFWLTTPTADGKQDFGGTCKDYVPKEL